MCLDLRNSQFKSMEEVIELMDFYNFDYKRIQEMSNNRQEIENLLGLKEMEEEIEEIGI